MAKLYFRYGTVCSAKTLNLLAVAHNYKSQGKHVLLLKPSVDDRFSLQTIKSRAGLEKDADRIIDISSSSMSNLLVDLFPFDGLDCILVDEVQFLTPTQIEQLREITIIHNIPVICYGLRSDFKSLLFPASRRLFELCDSIEEVKTTCYFCAKKSTMNLKHSDGVACFDGPSVQLGCEEVYLPACYACYKAKIFASRGHLAEGKNGLQMEMTVLFGQMT